jgi:hypothetical protein
MITLQAELPTVLKKSPEQSNLLLPSDKVNVTRGKIYKAEILESEGLHDRIKISHDAGDWWIFRPHWQYLEKEPITARFSLKQPPKGSNRYIWGELTFSNGTTFIASSGAPGYQYKGAHTIRGRGLIPPSDRWRINLPGYHLNTKGIEGWFFHITPDPHEGRAELGYHQDENVLGSAGCLISPVKVFKEAREYLLGLKEQKFIELEVFYS